MNLGNAIDQMYRGCERLIIIGLTGRTGSGCTTVAKILEQCKIESLDLKQCKEYDYSNVDERKNKVIYEYMKQDGRWSAFSVIEVSSVILASVLERGIDEFGEYINKITSEVEKKSVSIGEKEKVVGIINQLSYMFDKCKMFSLNQLDVESLEEEELKEYYEFYIKTIKEYKNRFKSILEGFSCFEIYSDKIKGKQQSKYHLYTYLMQQMGNNIRCSGNPFDDTFSAEQYREFVKRIDKVIKIIIKYDEVNNKKKCSRICIDAIRNPYEAMFLKDKYRSFHLMAVNTDDTDRRKRLKDLNTEELLNLDKIEYAQKLKLPQEVFYHQNIQECIQSADIHVYNPDISDGKYYTLTEQILKYISLMLHPGLVTPTHVERCMQLAYNIKFNSGCLSRQVGAVVTREDYSIQSVGWNDVPKGQVSCNLRDVFSYCKNKDKESYSKYEIENREFSEALRRINELTKGNTKGRCMAYCFKDVYNGLINQKNQVYTRALHAEENAFLQISKYGGTHVKNGYLFTTASPCELCAKKAYQLGIRHIYYIDPYPGISKNHILTFGKDNNPEMKLFFGAIGRAYLDFYEPRIAIKDELELITGVNVKDVVKGKKEIESLKYEDILYNETVIELKFISDRNQIESTRKISAEMKRSEIGYMEKKIVWTGSAYDGTRMLPKESDSDLSLEETSSQLPYTYKIKIGNPRAEGGEINYKILTSAKDEKHVMEPYLAHMVKNETKKLILRLVSPEGILENVKKVIYADLDMGIKIREDVAELKKDDKNQIYEYVVENANINYTYALEWKFI